jgi:hypothetical protein
MLVRMGMRAAAGVLGSVVAVLVMLPASTIAQSRLPASNAMTTSDGAGPPLSWKTTYSGIYNFSYTAAEPGGTGTDHSEYRWSDTVQDVVVPSGASFHEDVEEQTMASGSRDIVRSGSLGPLNISCKIQSNPATESLWERTGPSTLVPALGDHLGIGLYWAVPVPNYLGFGDEGSSWEGLKSPGGGSEGPGAVANGNVTVTGSHCHNSPNEFLGYGGEGCAACIFGSVPANPGLEASTVPSSDFLDAWGGGGSDGYENITLGDVIKKPIQKSFAVSWDRTVSGAGVTETGSLGISSNFTFSVCKDQEPNVFLYSARGSSETTSESDPNGLGAPALALYNVLKPRAASAGADLFDDGDPYPALDIQQGFYLDAAQHVVPTTHYKASVAEGVTDGVQALEHIASQQDATGKCWDLVLSGYSQGAEVMRRVMAALPEDVLAHVAAVELYGDPYFSPTEADVMPYGGYSSDAIGVRLYDWQVFQNGPPPPPLAVPTYSWCAPHDLVCGFNNSAKRLLLGSSTLSTEEAGHYTYGMTKTKIPCMAANQVIQALKSAGVDLAPDNGC